MYWFVFMSFVGLCACCWDFGLVSLLRFLIMDGFYCVGCSFWIGGVYNLGL